MDCVKFYYTASYYKIATHICCDCNEIYRSLYTVIYNRLKKQLKRKGVIKSAFIQKHYGKSKLIRFVAEEPMIPFSYVQTKKPFYKRLTICKYTPEGRKEIHRSLRFEESVIHTLHLLAKSNPYGKSIEYMDNRISLYAAQYGKCAITGEVLWFDEIHCHHKKPVLQGGTDEYKNLVIVHEDVHKLIHATKQETIAAYLGKLTLNKSQLDKINKLRIMAGCPAI